MADSYERQAVELWRAYDRLDHAYLVRDEMAVERELSLINTLQQGGAHAIRFEPFRRAAARAASVDAGSSHIPSGSVVSPDGSILLRWRELGRRSDGRGEVLVTVSTVENNDPALVRLRTESAAPGQPEDTRGAPLIWLVAVGSDRLDADVATGAVRIDDVGDWLQVDLVQPPPTVESIVDEDEVVRRSVATADARGRDAWRSLFRSLPEGHPAAVLVRQALRAASAP